MCGTRDGLGSDSKPVLTAFDSLVPRHKGAAMLDALVLIAVGYGLGFMTSVLTAMWLISRALRGVAP